MKKILYRNHISGELLKASRNRKSENDGFYAIFIQHCFRSSIQCTKARKRKHLRTGRKKFKCHLHMVVVWTENSKMVKLLELVDH